MMLPFLVYAKQREKVLEKQLHSLIEQLASKQCQAEILIADVRVKEKDLERLNKLNRNVHNSDNEVNTARNRTSRGLFGGPEDYDAKAGRRPYQLGANPMSELICPRCTTSALSNHLLFCQRSPCPLSSEPFYDNSNN